MPKTSFDEFDVRRLNDGEKPEVWWFEAAMVSTCKPLFDDCESNYDVEAKLRKAHVIRKDNQTDTESCALVVNFSSKKAGAAFVDRLNKYLEAKQAKLKEAVSF